MSYRIVLFVVALCGIRFCSVGSVELSAADTPKSLTIMLDGARGDVLLMGKLPTLDSLRNGTWAEGYHGAWTLSAHTIKDAGTASAANHTAIATGVTAVKTSVPNNDVFKNYNETGASAKYPIFLTRIKQKYPDKKTAFLANWKPDHFLVAENNPCDLFRCSADEDNAKKMVEVINGTYQDEKWAKGTDADAILWYIDAPDHAGHAGGFCPPGDKHPQYIQCLEMIDGWLANVLAAIKERKNFANEEWQIIITSDHGGWVGSHGAMSAECYTIPLIISSKNVKQGELRGQPCNADTAPTVLDHFGLDVAALKTSGAIDGSVRGQDVLSPVGANSTKNLLWKTLNGTVSDETLQKLSQLGDKSFSLVLTFQPSERTDDSDILTLGQGVRLWMKKNGEIGLNLKDEVGTNIELKQLHLTENARWFIAITVDRTGNAVLYAGSPDGKLFFCSQSLIDENLGKSFGKLTGKIDMRIGHPLEVFNNGLRIWNTALRVEEVKQIFEEGKK